MRKDNSYNFCIVTYETQLNPISQNLKTYLLENYHCSLLYIFHPMLDTDQSYKMPSGYYLYKNNKLSKSDNAKHWKFYWPLLYVKDMLYTFFWCLIFLRGIDVYFASGNLNPLVGIILRELGLVKKVVYQSLDYYPVRFNNIFLNWLYFQLDKFCVKFADETWNVSSRIAEGRHRKMDMDPKVFNRQYTVPGCIWFYKTKRLSFSSINPNKIVYRGSLLDFMGVDLVINAIPSMLKKMPKLVFEIIGIGKDKKRLIRLTKSLRVSKSVIFHGFIKGRQEMEKLLSDAALGVATFNTNILDDKVKNSDPGKIKDYMLMGMPVITTKEVYYHQKITEQRCGLVINYSVEDFAAAVMKLIKNKKLLKEYRENAAGFVEKFDCQYILGPNIERVLQK